MAPAPLLRADLRTRGARKWRRDIEESFAAFLVPSVICTVIWIAFTSGAFFWPIFPMLFLGLNLVKTVVQRESVIEREVLRLEEQAAKDNAAELPAGRGDPDNAREGLWSCGIDTAFRIYPEAAQAQEAMKRQSARRRQQHLRASRSRGVTHLPAKRSAVPAPPPILAGVPGMVPATPRPQHALPSALRGPGTHTRDPIHPDVGDVPGRWVVHRREADIGTEIGAGESLE